MNEYKRRPWPKRIADGWRRTGGWKFWYFPVLGTAIIVTVLLFFAACETGWITAAWKALAAWWWRTCEAVGGK